MKFDSFQPHFPLIHSQPNVQPTFHNNFKIQYFLPPFQQFDFPLQLYFCISSPIYDEVVPLDNPAAPSESRRMIISLVIIVLACHTHRKGFQKKIKKS